MADVITECRCA